MSEPYSIEKLRISPDSEIHALLSQCPEVRLLRFADGEFITREGDDSQDIFIVLRGGYVVEHGANGESSADSRPTEMALGMSDPANMSFVGEMAYLGARRRSASVRSSGATFTVCLEPRHLDAVMTSFPELTRVLCRQFATRLREANDLIQQNRERMAIEVDQVFLGAGEVLFNAGDKADNLYQLIDGSIAIERHGKEEVVAPGNLPLGFLEPLPYFRGSAHTATATTKTNVIMAGIGDSYRTAAILNYPELLLKIV